LILVGCGGQSVVWLGRLEQQKKGCSLSVRLRIEERGCPTYVGATLSRWAPPLDWTRWGAGNFGHSGILLVRGLGPAWVCLSRLILGQSLQWTLSGRPAESRARTKPAAACITYGSLWPAGAAHIAAVLQRDAVGSVGSQRALGSGNTVPSWGIRDLVGSAWAPEASGPVVPDFGFPVIPRVT